MVVARAFNPVLADSLLAEDIARRMLSWLPPRCAPTPSVLVGLMTEFLPLLRAAPGRSRPAVFRNWCKSWHVSSRYQGYAAPCPARIESEGGSARHVVTRKAFWRPIFKAEQVGDGRVDFPKLALSSITPRILYGGYGAGCDPQAEPGKSGPTQLGD